MRSGAPPGVSQQTGFKQVDSRNTSASASSPQIFGLSTRLVPLSCEKEIGDVAAGGCVAFDRVFAHLRWLHSAAAANRRRGREGGRECVRSGSWGGKREEEWDEVTKAPRVRRSQRERGMREKGQEEKRKEGASSSSYLNRSSLSLSLCCVCVCCECVRRQTESEGGEAYVASHSVNKSWAEGLNRALFWLIQIPPESTFILLIK